MKAGANKVFVDTGAWLAMALSRDPYHERARTTWSTLTVGKSPLTTSVPVVMETISFLERNAPTGIARAWRSSLVAVPRLKIAECSLTDMTKSWSWFEYPGLQRLSAVDATSFVLMQRLKIRTAFAFDQHFAQAGFALLG